MRPSSIQATVSRRRWELRNERIRFCGDQLFSADDQFNPADAEPVAVFQTRLLDSLAIHERAVRALEVIDLKLGGPCAQSAVEPRHERGIDDELRAGRSADRPD